MKFKRNIIIILFIFIVNFSFNLNVKAFSLECDKKEISKGEYVICDISRIDSLNGEEILVSSNLEIYESSASNPITKDAEIKFSTKKITDNSYDIIAESNINGKKTVTITVKDVTSTTTTKAKSSNNYLSTITINGKQIEGFFKNKTKYYINVSSDILKVVIGVELEDEKASYDINGPQPLEVGDNEYTIGVTSEDNTTRFYKIIITRALEEASSNTNISRLTISDYKLNFDGKSKTYHLNVDKEDNMLNIKVELEDKNASYEIEGNSNLKDGSVIKIIVTAENNDFDTYRIIISKEEKNNYLMYVIIGISALFIILLIIVILFKKKNNRRNKQENDNKTKIFEEKDADLEKTIQVPSLDIDNTQINNDEEETKMLSYEEKQSLEKTKVIDLNSEIEKAFEDTFNDINNLNDE